MDTTTITNGAALLQQMQGLSMAQALHLAIMAAFGLAFSMPLQAFVEHALAEQPWMNRWLPAIKPLLPTLVSGALGLLSAHFGVNPEDAMAMVAAMTGGAHLVNSSDKLAADAGPSAGPR